MDGKRFDDVSRVLGTAVTRQGIFQALAGLGAAGLAALTGVDLADARNGKGKGKGGHGKKNHRGNGGNSSKGKDGDGGGASAEGKRRKGKGKRKNRKKSDNQRTTQQASGDLCPSNQDKVCHCPPGNTTNCQRTGAGGGHADHDPLDCCCTLNGAPNPDCECPGSGSTCCKPLNTECANDSQCCGDLVCCDKDSAGIGTCQDACCVPLTCEDFEGQCGTFDNACGGEVVCNCPSGQGCCDNRCVTGGDECCVDGDCDDVICQIADCTNGDCTYTDVPDGEQGPFCRDADEFCCNGSDCCVSPEVCTGNGCCLPKTCAGDYPGLCGPQSQGCGLPDLNCTCGGGESCCGGECIGEGQCCETSDCEPRLCQNRDCVDHACEYDAVPNGDPGPLCNDPGEFCCNGNACCVAGQVCTGQGCCTPLTCRDFPGQCGTFQDSCGGQITCSCPEGQGCCGNVCVEGEQCCETADCPQQLCQTRDCVAGECDYTPVNDNEQGPLCDAQGEFCCGGDECCLTPEICTGQGCCTPKTCADIPGQCGVFSDECGGEISCDCGEGQGCCNGQCVAGEQCCVDGDCDLLVCQVADCVAGDCEYTGVPDGEQGPLCDGEGDFCCNGNDCCEPGDVCTGQGCCTPLTCADFPGLCGPQADGCGGQTASCTCPDPQVCLPEGECCIKESFEEACAAAGVACGIVSDGCGGTYDCGSCTSDQSCIAGVCLARGGKRCTGKGLAGQPCGGKKKNGKKCKCKAGRRCHNRKCCEPVGDGSRHCNADSDCCPGLTCVRKYPDQHKVCRRKGARSSSVTATGATTSTPGIALGAVVSGLLVKGASRLLAATGPDASIALEDLGLPTEPEV